MAAVSLLVIHFLGGGWVGLLAAIAAATAVYVPVVFPMRKLLRAPLPSAEELTETETARG
jgi:hypothetical protein